MLATLRISVLVILTSSILYSVYISMQRDHIWHPLPVFEVTFPALSRPFRTARRVEGVIGDFQAQVARPNA